MNIEEKFTKILEEFKKNAEEIVKGSISDIHSEYLPYVESDTAMNVSYRSEEVVRAIIEGKFTVEDNYIIVPSNEVSCRISIPHDGFYTYMLDKIVKHMPECPKDLKIKNLEYRIKCLEEMSYR